MKKSKYQPVYDKSGKASNVRPYFKKSGVYLIKEQGQLVYIGHSKRNLYKTALRHFQQWDDPEQIRISYAGKPRNWYTIRFVSTTPAKAEKLERVLVIKHQPRDNAIKYDSYTTTPADDAIRRQYEEAPF